jgi:hypothetical protein
MLRIIAKLHHDMTTPCHRRFCSKRTAAPADFLTDGVSLCQNAHPARAGKLLEPPVLKPRLDLLPISQPRSPHRKQGHAPEYEIDFRSLLSKTGLTSD